MKKIFLLSLVLLYSSATLAMNHDSSSEEERPLLEVPAEGISLSLKTEIGTISHALIELREHLVKDGGSYQTSERIKDILVTLKSIRQQVTCEVFRSTLEQHFDEIQTAAQANSEYYLNRAVLIKENFVPGLANAKANEVKVNRFCEYLTCNYNLFRGGIPLLK